MPLGPASRATLLALARAALRQAVGADRSLDDLLASFEPPHELAAPRGAFVTLRARGAREGDLAGLRGCIGHMDGTVPVWREVVDLVGRAALSDPRFPPVVAHEVDRLLIELSLLTPRRPCAGPETIVIGRDGVELCHERGRAVLLPRIALDQGWAAEQLLVHLALKAGLEPDGWRAGELFVFESEVFAEPEVPATAVDRRDAAL